MALSLCSMGTVALYVVCRRYVACCVLTCFGYGYWCYIYIYGVLLCAMGTATLYFEHCYTCTSYVACCVLPHVVCLRHCCCTYCILCTAICLCMGATVLCTCLLYCRMLCAMGNAASCMVCDALVPQIYCYTNVCAC